MLHLFDTALDEVAPLEPRRPGELSMYVCGPTVSGSYHLGHGRFTIVWDVIRRYAEWSGFKVRYVSNITDIEDKIIARSHAEKRTTEEVAAHYEAVWWEAMDRLGVRRPTADPHATAYVPDMIKLIDDLIGRGHAYVGGDGVYLSVETIPGYGLLARQPLETLKAGARIEATAEAGKRSPVDFVLWKRAKAGEPSWESPWGDGRPGWHTECVVMSLDLLGEGFDLHGGGIDLAFPHHENERAQAVGVGREFARRWVHSGMVVVEGGEKMSKSAGNGLSLQDVLAAHDPRALRLLFLQAHYRSPVTVSSSTLEAAGRTVEGLDTFAREFEADRGGEVDESWTARFAERMDDDLDTPQALAHLFDWVKQTRASGDPAVRSRRAAAVLQLWEGPLGLPIGQAGAEIPAHVLARAAERDAARQARDFATADRIRDELTAEGWTVEDGPSGTTIR